MYASVCTTVVCFLCGHVLSVVRVIIIAKVVQQIKTAVTITILFVLSSATDITSQHISMHQCSKLVYVCFTNSYS